MPLLEARERGWTLDSFLSHFAGMDEESVHLAGCTAGGPLTPVDLGRVRPAYHHVCCACWKRSSPLDEDFEVLTGLLDAAARLGELGDELKVVLELLAHLPAPGPLGYRHWALLTRTSRQLEEVRALRVSGELVDAAEELIAEVSDLSADLRTFCEESGTSVLEGEVLACSDEPVLRLVQPSRTGESIAAAWGAPVLVGKWFLAAAPGLPRCRSLEVAAGAPSDLLSVAQTASTLHASSSRGDDLFDPVEAVKAALLLS